MKKLFTLLGGCLAVLGSSQAATLNVSNYNAAGNGSYGIANSAGMRYGGTAGYGVLGRMVGLSEQAVQDLATAGNVAALNAAFSEFGSPFALDSAGAGGAFATQVTVGTKASVAPGVGGSALYVWFYNGAARASATEYLLVKLNQTIPTDSETLPPQVVDVYVNPEGVAGGPVAGTFGVASYDYGQGSGALGLYQTISTTTSANVAPVANDGTLAVFSGRPKNGQLTGSDANNDTLSFFKVSDPSKGSVVVNLNGTYTYTATVGETGTDTFTFKANDGDADSNVATITLTIAEPPPNTAPVALAASFSGPAGNAISGQLSATDENDDVLSFQSLTAPANGSLQLDAATGFFTYRPASGFAGVDSFTFVANDGVEDSAPVKITLVVEDGIPSWVWIDGDKVAKQRAAYGTRGVADVANKPGARTEAASASGLNGISYHFGGLGYGEGTKPGALNDLWSYNAVSREWTWLSGGKDVNAAGSYGQKGLAAESNVPPARSGALMWLDDAGSLWVFGGAASTKALLNDVWKYDLAENQWTWMGGSDTANANGTYGTLGQADEANAPGARTNAVAWTDASGRFYVFGGRGYPASGTKAGLLNDLWMLDPAEAVWTWVNGGNGIDAIGSYGMAGAPSAANVPGGRQAATGWIGAGSFWLFGGNGRGNSAKAGNLNDLWEYSFLTNEWTWVNGPAVAGAAGVYGTLGEPADSNLPASRAGAAGAVAPDGSLLLFGGQGSGYYNDVWRYDTEESQWTWIKGPAKANGPALYGEFEVPTPSATPGARRGASAIVDGTSNTLLIFEGINGANSNNDVWQLPLPKLPSVILSPVAGITETGAAITAVVDPQGSDTSVSLLLINLADEEDEEEIDLGQVSGDAEPATLNELLADLQPGTAYAVIIQAENAMGRAQSLPRLFTTGGTPAAAVVRFVEASSQAGEGQGSASVNVSLNRPASESFTVPFTLGGTAASGASGDYEALPASGVLSFIAGQSRATITLLIKDDATLDDGETVQITLGTPSVGTVTLGAAVHTLTILDNDAAPVFVQTPGSRLVRLGSELVLDGTVSVSSGVTYQWSKAGKKIAKATLPTYTLPVTKLTDSGTYTIEAINSLGNATTSFDVAVADLTGRAILQAANKPLKVTIPVSAPATAGLQFQWHKDEEPLAGQTSNTLNITPAGVEDSGDYTLSITFPGVGTLVTEVVRVSIYETLALPSAALAGTYVGLVDVSEEGGAPLGGRFDLTVTTKGAYTAKLTLGTAAMTSRGQLLASETQGSGTAVFARKGLASIMVEFEVEEGETDPASGTMSGVVRDPATGGSTWMQGYRNRWSKTDLATTFEGAYTFGLDIPVELEGSLSIPQGQGFGALTVSNVGVASYVGRTADGGKFTFSSIVGSEGHAPFYAAFTTTQGYLLGTPVIDPEGEGNVDGSLFWKKLPADAKSKELAYRAGFDEIELTVVGGKWQGPGNGEVIAGFENTDNNVALELNEGGAGLEPYVFTIKNPKATGVTQQVVINKANNPNSVSLKLIAKPVGHYSGTFVIPDASGNKALNRSATYQGTFIRRADGNFTRAGFFLLALPPQPGETVKTSAQLSGQALIVEPDL